MAGSLFRQAISALAVAGATATGPEVSLGTSPTVTFGIAGNTITASAAGGGGGNTGFISAGGATASLGTVVFSNSNGLAFGIAGQTVTGSYTVPAQSNQQITLFATGNTTQSSTGTTNASSLIFRGEGIVSMGITGGSIVASATQSNQAFSASGGSSTFQTLGFENANGFTFSNVGGSVRGSYTVPTVTNSSWTVSDNGTSGTVARLAFTNQNGVTLSLSTGAGGSHTIVGSHNALTSQSNQAASAANGSFAFQTISFSNLNGISFGTSAGSAITASHNALTSQSNQAFSAAGGSSAFQTLGFSDNAAGSFTNTNGSVALASIRASLFAVSNTTQSSSGTQNLNALSFAGAGIASVGVTNGSVVVSVPAGGGAGDGGVFAGVSTFGNTAGSTGTVSTGNFVLVGTNGISLSQSTGAAGSAATITIDGGVPLQPLWAPYAVGQQGGGGAHGQATLHMAPVSAPFPATFDRVGFYVSRSNATNSTGSMTLSGWFGLYTKNVSTLSLLMSASSSLGISFHGTVSSWSQHGGPRHFTIGFSSSVSPGDYWAAVITRTTSGGANNTINQMLLSQFTQGYSGVMGVGSAATAQEVLGKGVYTASTSGLPASIAFSELNGTASLAHRAPIWVAMNGTA